MENCNNGINIPQTTVEPCGGTHTSTDCIKTPNSITYLDLPAGASQGQINAAVVTALTFKDEQIAERPVPDGTETKIISGTNTTITGSGTTATPYIVTAGQALQSVLNKGTYAEVDNGAASATLLGGSEYRNTSFKVKGVPPTYGDFFTGGYLSIDDSGVYINSGENLRGTGLSMGRGNFMLTKWAGSVWTQISINEPTIDTIIKFPAKAIAGTYTLATIDDIARMGNLPIFENNTAAIAGALAANYIYRTSTGELRIVV